MFVENNVGVVYKDVYLNLSRFNINKSLYTLARATCAYYDARHIYSEAK